MAHANASTAQMTMPPATGRQGNGMTRLLWRDGFDGPHGGELGDWHWVLTPETVHRPFAPWLPALCSFARILDGYGALGGLEPVAELANAASGRWRESGELPDDLVELRACLFFEQRRQRWLDQAAGERPAEGPWLAYRQVLVEAG